MDFRWRTCAVAIGNANSNQSKGSFDGPTGASTIEANGQLRSAEEFKAMVVAYRNGAAVRLADVAEVADAAENAQLAAWADDSPAVIINIQRQPGANVIEVVDRIKRVLPQLRASLPAAIDVTVLTDRTVTIRASVRDVRFELLLAVVLVVMVIFLFLRNLTATVIPSVVVPLSLIGAFAVMYLAGFSINNLTLMALTIATGFVVDDAIVMIENISRHIEAGDPPLQAALKGVGQIGFHHHFADALPHRRPDPASFHGRRRRAPVPRVRDHARRRHPDIGRGIAHADAHDVRAIPAPRARPRAGALLPRQRRVVRPRSSQATRAC